MQPTHVDQDGVMGKLLSAHGVTPTTDGEGCVGGASLVHDGNHIGNAAWFFDAAHLRWIQPRMNVIDQGHLRTRDGKKVVNLKREGSQSMRRRYTRRKARNR
jgi:hypothetical protein